MQRVMVHSRGLVQLALSVTKKIMSQIFFRYNLCYNRFRVLPTSSPRSWVNFPAETNFKKQGCLT